MWRAVNVLCLYFYLKVSWRVLNLSEFRFNFDYEPLRYGHADQEAGLELDADGDEDLVLAAVDVGVGGEEFGEVHGHHRFGRTSRVEAEVHVLVVLVSHDVGTGAQEHLSGVVLCVKFVVRHGARNTVLEVGAWGDIAHLKAGGGAGPGSLVRRDANDLDQEVIM